LLQLVKSPSTKCVGTDETRLPILALVVGSKLYIGVLSESLILSNKGHLTNKIWQRVELKSGIILSATK
jgi:hypothetical protein